MSAGLMPVTIQNRAQSTTRTKRLSASDLDELSQLKS